MSRFVRMLDTNILSDAIRNPFGAVAEAIDSAVNDSLCVSAIVASELRFGAARRGSDRLTHLVENSLARIAILGYDDRASHHFADIRSALEKRGTPIGTTDLFIAAHARSLDLTLVTNNVREFTRVDGLKIENWLEGSAS
ncbi:type II toxin-antitoxin system VapC family toxin [Neorhizobium sp. JUb45]|uniref:type II toxin-antitoxin system VapC family toxin n=1 Tax=unclassified Neorhizobium TaxID=2629175 RepID=UPI00104D714D|nr:type II toxin-antitoxin system VapC family toxin [Neorhizobium sp. JUb45]TCR04422.1 tRNA(fMet)-specific endonuclease VapC [Neorhizobium sp. JUb45]